MLVTNNANLCIGVMLNLIGAFFRSRETQSRHEYNHVRCGSKEQGTRLV